DIRIDPVPGQPDIKQDGVARAFDARPDAPTYLFVRGDDRTPDTSRALTPAVPAALGGEVAVQPVRWTARDFARALEPAAATALRQAKADLAAAEAARAPAKGARAVARAEKHRTAARAALAAVEART